jgi:hypothetical protein
MLRDGHQLAPIEKAETFALLTEWTWLGREDADAVVEARAQEPVMTYLLDNLAPQTKVTLWAVSRLREVSAPPRGHGSSESRSRRSRSRKSTGGTRAMTPRQA